MENRAVSHDRAGTSAALILCSRHPATRISGVYLFRRPLATPYIIFSPTQNQAELSSLFTSEPLEERSLHCHVVVGFSSCEAGVIPMVCNTPGSLDQPPVLQYRSFHIPTSATHSGQLSSALFHLRHSDGVPFSSIPTPGKYCFPL